MAEGIFMKAVDVCNAPVYRAIQCTLDICYDCIISFRSWSKTKIQRY